MTQPFQLGARESYQRAEGYLGDIARQIFTIGTPEEQMDMYDEIIEFYKSWPDKFAQRNSPGQREELNEMSLDMLVAPELFSRLGATYSTDELILRWEAEKQKTIGIHEYNASSTLESSATGMEQSNYMGQVTALKAKINSFVREMIGPANNMYEFFNQNPGGKIIVDFDEDAAGKGSQPITNVIFDFGGSVGKIHVGEIPPNYGVRQDFTFRGETEMSEVIQAFMDKYSPVPVTNN
jgi:hypothetical protein